MINLPRPPPHDFDYDCQPGQAPGTSIWHQAPIPNEAGLEQVEVRSCPHFLTVALTGWWRTHHPKPHVALMPGVAAVCRGKAEDEGRRDGPGDADLTVMTLTAAGLLVWRPYKSACCSEAHR